MENNREKICLKKINKKRKNTWKNTRKINPSMHWKKIEYWWAEKLWNRSFVKDKESSSDAEVYNYDYDDSAEDKFITFGQNAYD